MREIKFRGKRCSDGEWVYGSYLESNRSWAGHKPHKSWIVCSVFSNGGWLSLMGRYAVKDDTIGQFTGLQDKNGREIYEGDIVRKTETTYRMTDLGVVRYCNEAAKFVLHVTDKYSEYNFSFVKDFQSQDGHATVPCHNEYEVVGNVYDDKELLKQ